jgi:hypothetical protein
MTATGCATDVRSSWPRPGAWTIPAFLILAVAAIGQLLGPVAVLATVSFCLVGVIALFGEDLLGVERHRWRLAISAIVSTLVLFTGSAQLVGLGVAHGRPAEAVDLSGQVLNGERLREVDLRGAHLSGSVLDRVDLRGRCLDGADLAGASLSHTRLDGASLRGADLRGAALDHTSLRGADLSGADLTGLNLARADWTGAIRTASPAKGSQLTCR